MTKTPNQDTGLRLLLSNNIVLQHGGPISVDTRDGELTEMSILNPQHAAERIAKRKLAQRETVLLRLQRNQVVPGMQNTAASVKPLRLLDIRSSAATSQKFATLRLSAPILKIVCAF